MQDYIHRPIIYANLSLYDWIRWSIKSKRTKKQLAEFNDKLEENADQYDQDFIDDDNDELDILADVSYLGGRKEVECETDEFISYDSLDELSETEANNADANDPLNLGDDDAQYMYEDEHVEHQFLKSHPQFHTHLLDYVICHMITNAY